MHGRFGVRRMLNRDYRDILSALSDARVDFLVVGAYALAFYGLPRATGDIDLWVRSSEDNASRIIMALAAFGVPIRDLNERDLCSPGVVFQIGVPPGRIDILTELTGSAAPPSFATSARPAGREISQISRICNDDPSRLTSAETPLWDHLRFDRS